MSPRIWPLALAAALGCGPSFQAIYEGDAKFEHCYALEEDPNIAMAYKSDCWHDWMRRFTYGQTRDRVQYAANRYAALTRAPANPTDEAMMGAAPGEQGENLQLTAPAPTSAYSAPPTTMNARVDAGTTAFSGESYTAPPEPVDAGSASKPESRAPLADCTDACSGTWKSCRATCEAKGKGCERCEKPYRACMKGCAK